MKQNNANTGGILLMCAAMGMFTANDTLVKLLSEHFTIPQIMALRGIFACVFSFFWLIGAGYGRALVHLKERRILLRSCCEAGSAIAYLIALSHMPIADLTAIFLSTPLILTLAAAWVLKEKVSWRIWIAVMLGFIGVLMVMKPGTSGFTYYALLILASALFVTTRDLMTRGINPIIPSLAINLAANTANMLLGFGVTVFEFAQQPLVFGKLASLNVWLALFTAAIVITMGNYGVILAYRNSSVAVISPFRYSAIIWAMLSGLLVWRQIPDALSLCGAVLIIGSGLYVLHHEQVARRKLPANAVDHAG